MNSIKFVALSVAILGTFLFLNHYFNKPETWEAYNEKGLAAVQENHFDEAEKHFLKSLEIAESLDPNDPRIYFSLTQLAELYRINSKFREAESILKRLLEIDRKKLGPKHPNLAFGLNNLAGIYRVQGRLEEAEDLLKEALEILDNSYDKDHPLIGNLNEHYAHLLHQMGRHSDAEKLEKRFQ